jgi:hypothetical protein
MDVVAGGRSQGSAAWRIPIVRERFLFFRIIRRETYILAEYAGMREDGRATRRYRFVPLEHTRAAQRRFAGRFRGAALWAVPPRLQPSSIYEAAHGSFLRDVDLNI